MKRHCSHLFLSRLFLRLKAGYLLLPDLMCPPGGNHRRKREKPGRTNTDNRTLCIHASCYTPDVLKEGHDEFLPLQAARRPIMFNERVSDDSRCLCWFCEKYPLRRMERFSLSGAKVSLMLP